MIQLDGLNLEQRKAAETVEGPVLILAGAGSGKTRTVTYRIGHMLENLKIPPDSVLAVSFTNKAAREMDERVKDLVHYRFRKGLTLSTFHSLAIKILREEIHHLGYRNNFTIYDSADQMSIIREALRSLKTDKKSFDKKLILSKIGFLKNNSIGHQDFAQSPFFDEASPYDVATEYVYHYYQDKLHFYNAVDFDDILFLCVKLFNEHPEVAKKYSQKFRYIMIDEYQDTNPLQFNIVKGLTSTHHNICVVGDDDQSIYSFRGADISNILQFEKMYPNTTTIKLERNYRSTNPILNLANDVIKQNPHRKDKTMWSSQHSDHKPLVWVTQDTDHEAAVIADDIVQLQKKGVHLSQVAILYRSNTQVPPMEDQLRLSQIPYHIMGGQKLFEKKEVKDLIAYLSVIKNPKDELSLRRILNVPNRGVGTAGLKNLLKIGHEHKTSLYETIKRQSQFGVDKKSLSLKKFIETVESMKTYFSSTPLHQGLNELTQRINYFPYIEKSYDETKQIDKRKMDVHHFISSAERFEQNFKQEASLENFLEKMLLIDNQDSRSPAPDNEKRNEVTLMTLHSSKGLEFDYIYLIGAEEELLPHKKTIQEDGDLHEERRLAYVGITRAKERLVMTYCKERKIYNKKTPRHKSRFLIGHEEHYVEQDRTTFGHLSEEEEKEFKENFFDDLLMSLE